MAEEVYRRRNTPRPTLALCLGPLASLKTRASCARAPGLMPRCIRQCGGTLTQVGSQCCSRLARSPTTALAIALPDAMPLLLPFSGTSLGGRGKSPVLDTVTTLLSRGWSDHQVRICLQMYDYKRPRITQLMAAARTRLVCGYEPVPEPDQEPKASSVLHSLPSRNSLQ